MLALALIAIGVFMGLVLYGSGDGGGLGHALAVALGWSVGRAKVLAPLSLVGAGAAMLMRPVLPAMRPLRTGSLCLFAAVMLALAAGTLGVSSGQSTTASQWSSHYLQAHGGAAGQALYEAAHRLVQQVGVDILVVFLLVVGVILLTGASLAAVLRATGSGMVDSTRMLKARVSAERGATEDSRAPAPQPIEERPSIESLLPPEPGPRGAGRASHARGGAVTGRGRARSSTHSRSPRRKTRGGGGRRSSVTGVAVADPDDLTPAGPPARAHHRRSQLRVAAAGRRQSAVALERRAGASRHRRAGAHRRQPDRRRSATSACRRR